MLFIHHSNTSDILEELAVAVIERRIITLLGPDSSGKSWLLQYLASAYWSQEREMQFRTPRVVYAEPAPQLGKSAGRYSTAMTVEVFTHIASSLAALSRQHDSELVHLSKVWYRQPQSQYTDRQFSSLLAFVRDEVKRLDISALLIDNAQLLDEFTVEKLMELRRLRQHQLGLIFCASIEKAGVTNEHVDRLLDVIIKTKHKEDCELHLELAALTPAETWGPVLKGLLKQLSVVFDPNLSTEEVTLMRGMFWKETRGDWKTIDVRRRRLEHQLGPNTGNVRHLTREIFEKMMGKSLGSPSP